MENNSPTLASHLLETLPFSSTEKMESRTGWLKHFWPMSFTTDAVVALYDCREELPYAIFMTTSVESTAISTKNTSGRLHTPSE